MKRTAAALAACLALAACSGGGDEETGLAESVFGSANGLAGVLDCANYDELQSTGVAGDVATCELNGEQVSLAVGRDAVERDAAEEFARKEATKFARVAFTVVEGRNWSVLAPSAATADQARSRLAGDASSSPTPSVAAS